MSLELSFTLNGQIERAVGIDPHTSLLHYLRARGLTGTKEGCAEGECGACAVVMLERTADGAACYEAVNACLLLLPAVQGRSLWTVEGIGRAGALHPVQAALVQQAGSQCGYCTPGFVMSLFAHYYRVPRDEVDHALGGNLCRCTGYRPIRDAARSLPQRSEADPFLRHTAEPPPPLQALTYQTKQASFLRPTTLDELLQLRAQKPELQLIAGGTDLVVEVNQQGRRHPGFVSLEAVDALRSFEEQSGTFALGAALSWNELNARLAGRIPMLAALFPLFASRLIRARATVGGNLVTASPVGDSAPVLLSLDAELELTSVRGRRRVPLAEFFVGYRKTALAADELLTRVFVPAAPPTLARFYKVSKRVLDDISGVSAAFALNFEGERIAKARLAFGGVAATPTRALAAESALLGKPWDRETLGHAREQLRTAFTPLSDVRASAAYRSAIVESLFDKFFHEARP